MSSDIYQEMTIQISCETNSSSTTKEDPSPGHLSLGFMILDDDSSSQNDLITSMVSWNMTFISTNLTLQHKSLDAMSVMELKQPLVLESINVRTTEHISVTVPYVRHHFTTNQVLSDDRSRLKASLHLRRLFDWAGHLGVSAVILPLPESHKVIPEFARCVISLCTLVPYTSIWIHIRIANAASGHACWYNWNLFRSLVPQTGVLVATKFHLALELCQHALSTNSNVDQWLAEPIASLIVPTDSFTSNKKGYLVLSKSYQQFLFKFMKRNLYFIISSTRDSPDACVDLSDHAQYFRHLHRNRPKSSVIDRFARGYMDHLQAPLQPLMDNLDAYTYSVFERDPIKYLQYTEAVKAFLADLSHISSESVQELNVLVVGAGPRGPLIDCVINGAGACNVRVVGVEKNRNAYVSLLEKKRTHWDTMDSGTCTVDVIFSDIRNWQSDSRFDLIVSELLGSFGDNELSPECLDGVQHLLKEHGACIPQSYTPWIAPVSSTKLHEHAQKLNTPGALETSYVVMVQNAHLVSPAKPLWTFSHPSEPIILPDNLHNQRYVQTCFPASKHPTLVHGFVGYFECVLYGNVTVSTRPETHTPDMTSWFPIYFPITYPLLVCPGTTTNIHVWRVTGANRVWYEWAIVPEVDASSSVDQGVDLADSSGFSVPGTGSLIHNAGGKFHSIGL